jgi:hypothetical protein
MPYTKMTLRSGNHNAFLSRNMNGNGGEAPDLRYSYLLAHHGIWSGAQHQEIHAAPYSMLKPL